MCLAHQSRLLLARVRRNDRGDEPVKKGKSKPHAMGDWRKERRDKQLIRLIGFSRLKGLVSARRKGVVDDLLSVYSLLREIRVDLQLIQQTTDSRLPSWRSLSPWMKIQLAHLALCEFDARAFTVHLNPRLQQSLLSQIKKADYIRRRLTLELGKVTEGPANYFFVVELVSGTGTPVSPHIHGAVELGDADEDTIRQALLRACGHQIRGSATTLKASHLVEPYAKAEKWSKYSAKNLRRRGSPDWLKRHGISRGATEAARELWGHFDDLTK